MNSKIQFHQRNIDEFSIKSKFLTTSIHKNRLLYNIQRSIKYFPNWNGDAPNNSPHSTWEYINVDNCSDQIAISLAVRPIHIKKGSITCNQRHKIQYITQHYPPPNYKKRLLYIHHYTSTDETGDNLTTIKA